MPCTSGFGVSRGSRRSSVSRSRPSTGGRSSDLEGLGGPEDHGGLGERLGDAGRSCHDRGLHDVRDRRPTRSGIDEVMASGERRSTGIRPAPFAQRWTRRPGCRDAEVRTLRIATQPRAGASRWCGRGRSCRRRRRSQLAPGPRRMARSPSASTTAPARGAASRRLGQRASLWRRRRDRTGGPPGA